ncbi:efflux RND transporter permease subunit, partial [Salmonella enterica subsp. enterica serovar Virginia]|nr:efflux RND transporter permease subunit [Salmonella enterica subsp. enterica serovar Virginia]
AELQPFFPQGMKVVYPYDTTPFVKISIHEVVKTLFEAIILVLLEQAHCWLFISSLINHRLTGEFTTDITMAGTSQLLDIHQRD